MNSCSFIIHCGDLSYLLRDNVRVLKNHRLSIVSKQTGNRTRIRRYYDFPHTYIMTIVCYRRLVTSFEPEAGNELDDLENYSRV